MKLAEVGNGQFHGAVASQQTGIVVAGNAYALSRLCHLIREAK